MKRMTIGEALLRLEVKEMGPWLGRYYRLFHPGRRAKVRKK